MSGRGDLPIAIVKKAGDHSFGAWELVYDHMGQIHSRRHRFGEDPRWEVRPIRIDEPWGMVAGESVPFDERDRLAAEAEDRRRERRALVGKLADEFVRGERNHLDLRTDFQLEREVMDELWSRFREVTGDRFLLNAVAATQPQSSPERSGGGHEG